MSGCADTMSSTINSIRDLAAAARGRRLELGLSQSDLATRARVSRQWISEFESGKPSAEFGLVLRLLEGLGLRLSVDEPAAAIRGAQPPRRETADLDALLEDYRGR
jgi:HTH-type transcriptional regulator / antitoxin HipB